MTLPRWLEIPAVVLLTAYLVLWELVGWVWWRHSEWRRRRAMRARS